MKHKWRKKIKCQFYRKINLPNKVDFINEVMQLHYLNTIQLQSLCLRDVFINNDCIKCRKVLFKLLMLTGVNNWCQINDGEHVCTLFKLVYIDFKVQNSHAPALTFQYLTLFKKTSSENDSFYFIINFFGLRLFWWSVLFKKLCAAGSF